MEVKVLKFVILICLTTGVSNAWADNFVLNEWEPGGKLMLSKNPKNWEEEYPGEVPAYSSKRPQCYNGSGCGIVKSVYKNIEGDYECMTVKGFVSNCQELVKKFGINILKTNILINVPYSFGWNGKHLEDCLPDFNEARSSQFCH